MGEPFLEATVSVRGVVCRADGRVVTVRRASDGGWELPGGRMHRGEPVTECLRREIEEETGLDVTVTAPVHALSWQNGQEEDRFAVYYHCRTDDEAVSLSEEHTAAGWVGGATARDRLSAPQAEAIARALRTALTSAAATDD